MRAHKTHNEIQPPGEQTPTKGEQKELYGMEYKIKRRGGGYELLGVK